MSSNFVHTPLRPDLGDEIKRIRGMHADSQADFAVRLGRPRSDQGLISKWEKGREVPSKADVLKIAEVAGLPVESFYGDPPDTADRERREKLIAARWMRRLADGLVGDVTEATEDDGEKGRRNPREISEEAHSDRGPEGTGTEGDGA